MSQEHKSDMADLCSHDAVQDSDHDDIINRNGNHGNKDFTPDRESILMDVEHDQDIGNQGKNYQMCFYLSV